MDLIVPLLGFGERVEYLRPSLAKRRTPQSATQRLISYRGKLRANTARQRPVRTSLVDWEIRSSLPPLSATKRTARQDASFSTIARTMAGNERSLTTVESLVRSHARAGHSSNIYCADGLTITAKAPEFQLFDTDIARNIHLPRVPSASIDL